MKKLGLQGWVLAGACLYGQDASVIRTIAGTDWTFQASGKPALNAPIGTPEGVVYDAAGNAYLADSENHLVLRIARDGIITVVAGNGFAGIRGDGGDALQASLVGPYGVAIGPDGLLYILDGGVRRVGPDGKITAVYRGSAVSFGATFGDPSPNVLAVDRNGNLLIAQSIPRRVVRISPNGAVTPIAGNGQAGSTGDGGPALNAALTPAAVAVDAAGLVYIADSAGSRVRRINPDGTIMTVAGGGNGTAPQRGDGGLAVNAILSSPHALAFDAAGNLYIYEFARVRRVRTDGVITTVAGNGTAGVSGDGGPATSAAISNIGGVSVDSGGNPVIADTNGRRVRRVTSDGRISTIAGNGLYRFSPEGAPATLAFFKSPYRVAVAPDGAVYVSDRSDNRIKKIDTAGRLTTFAGNGQAGVTPRTGRGPDVPITAPNGVAVNARGEVYAIFSGAIYKITPDGTLTQFATFPANEGASELALGPDGSVYVSSSSVHRIRKYSADGLTNTIIAGTGTAGFSGDNGPATSAQLNAPTGLAIDANSNVFVADTRNGRIRKITPAGVISTVAASNRNSLSAPLGLALDANGTFYTTDSNGSRIQVVQPDGSIVTLAGSTTPGFAGDGGPSQLAALSGGVVGLPSGIAVLPNGTLYVADSGNFRVRQISRVSVTLTRTPSALSFTARAGDAPPQPQRVSLDTTLVGVPYSTSVSTSNGGSWLKVSASSPVTPASLDVTVDPSELEAGSYQGAITITSPVPGVAAQSVSVSFAVEAAIPAAIGVDVNGLAFSFVTGSGAASKKLVALNRGGGALDFTATASTSSGGNWLSVTPANGKATGAAPVTLVATADPAGLPTGTYTGAITLTEDADGDRLQIPVSMTVSASNQSIRLGLAGVTFTAVVGGGATPAQSVAVLNTGQGSFSFSAGAIVAGSVPQWLSVTPDAGTSDSGQPAPSITISVDPSGLSAGDYYGRIQVRSATADNSPQELTVVLNLLPAGSDPGPIIQPSGLVFTAVQGEGDPGSQSVVITNLTSSTLNFGSSAATLDGGRYISYQPAFAEIEPGSLRLAVQPNISGLAAGVYRGAIVLVYSNGSIQTIGLLIVVAPAGTKLNSIRAAEGCSPTRLLPLVTSLGSNFSVPASWPTAIETRVVDDCGSPVTSGSVIASFSNGDTPLSLTSLNDGRWTGTWLSRNTSQRQVSVSVVSEVPALQLRGTVQVSGGLSGDANPPSIRAGSIVSSASLASQLPLAPGAVVRIYGTRLADGEASSPALPLETQLANATVIVGGKALPLFSAADGQLDAQLPFDLPVNARLQLLVTRGTRISVPEEVTIAAAQPAIFTNDGSGQGQGKIFVVKDGSTTLADSGAPAQAGNTLLIHCSGLGAVDKTVADGAAGPSEAANTVAPVSVTIGGVSAPVSSAILAPGMVGVYFVQATVPEGVSAGDQTQVVVTVAGQSSPAVTIATR